MTTTAIPTLAPTARTLARLKSEVLLADDVLMEKGVFVFYKNATKPGSAAWAAKLDEQLKAMGFHSRLLFAGANPLKGGLVRYHAAFELPRPEWILVNHTDADLNLMGHGKAILNAAMEGQPIPEDIADCFTMSVHVVDGQNQVRVFWA